ncbi:ABC transporter permease [Siphonobacter aquaeclarae]|uniref:ABC-type antimicrobial peptide transport system, permease component n=1 Tax=Siphonobacter aquaeclarae TaxID=563176 RepID=A0A1G9LHA5_9BACT|nr:ABC transporter permease [Siphonobacter aquaeclarae]SDL61342.1 ABC-type antimicrobial peptide transport system, permease component [Siphonobacter aquaeclarae]
MLRNYILLAWRNLLKHRGYSLINIAGLSIGMTVALLIGLWVYDELTFNQYHDRYDRIARVMQHQTINGEVSAERPIPFPLGNELQTAHGSDFRHVVMASWMGGHILANGADKLSRTGIFMDTGAPELLGLRMRYGTRTGLADPHSILLSESAARALYGGQNPLGKRLSIDNALDVRVTGVYEDLPVQSDFHQMTFLAPWSLYVESEAWIKRARDRQQWANNSFQLFVELADGADLAAVNKRIRDAKYRHVTGEERKYKAEIFLHPMADWHLRSHWDKIGAQAGGPVEYVWLFAVIGVFVLLLACINFMNLSTARSERRAREVGVRKAMGSARGQLIGQFFSESLLVSFLALAVAILLAELSLPWFNIIAGKQITFPWGAPLLWVSLGSFAAITGLLAGSYPALYLSSFQPVKVLKGTFRAGQLATLPRQALVVIQFSVSIALIIGTAVVYRQILHTKNRPVGYSRDGIVLLEMKSNDFYGKMDVLRNELKSAGLIEEIAESSSPLTEVWATNVGFSWPGKDPSLDAEFGTIWITPEYGKLVRWEMAAGRDFRRDLATDSSGILLNEAAAKYMGLKDPVGKTVRWSSGSRFKDFTVVGVVKNLLMESPYAAVRPAVYFRDDSNVNWMMLRLNPRKPASESLAGIERVFRKVIPAAPFEYEFADRMYGQKFAAEERIGTLAAVFAGLAVFISCLGLLGLASFVAEQRTKEIGIRKVLGASIVNLWGLLSRDFAGLVVLSFFLAVLPAWYAMTRWLGQYEYRAGLPWWIFAAVGLGAVILTLLTVSIQSIRAASVNPVKSLKAE